MKDLDFKNFILYGSYLKCSSSHGKTDLKHLLTNLAKKFTITEAFAVTAVQTNYLFIGRTYFTTYSGITRVYNYSKRL
jgi:hypothetical protein